MDQQNVRQSIIDQRAGQLFNQCSAAIAEATALQAEVAQLRAGLAKALNDNESLRNEVASLSKQLDGVRGLRLVSDPKENVG